MTLLHAHDYGGEGPQLVLLHGYGRSLADWDASAVLLTAGHRVLAVDLPGHGRSSGISPWTIPAVGSTSRTRSTRMACRRPLWWAIPSADWSRSSTPERTRTAPVPP
ncbi:alpha/beta fold hydrolase [Streptomyces avermitilis]|uniref:alpha/beta fold hydrolase n=1 Tax=Streptomyces avermitilis TaxID=33903 RepID=UPI0036CE8596